MINHLTYRLATIDDFAAVHQLYMESSTNPFLAYDIMNDLEFFPIYEELIQSGSLYIAETEMGIAGSYHLINKKYRQSNTVYLSTFIVHPDVRGKGYAKEILHHLISSLKDQRKNRIELEVSVNNEKAIALYRSVGFEMEGRVRQSYRYGNGDKYYDDYLMGLLLNEAGNI